MKFSDLSLIDPILKALQLRGYTSPTPIQEKSIPIALQGGDLIGCAQTGTGKTAAFVIPMLQNLHNNIKPSHKKRKIRGLVIVPTRELATQIAEGVGLYGKGLGFHHAVIFGGVKHTGQIRVLQKGVDIIIATPGRLLDMMNQKHATMKDLECLVLDEADEMLNQGFIHDIKKIVAQLPTKKQTLFFSATMPLAVQELTQKFLINPQTVSVAPISSASSTVTQKLYTVEKKNKRPLLSHVLAKENINSVLVFTRTKHGANKLSSFLSDQGIKSAAIHGNKSQAAREKALLYFKTKKIRVLVATDVAARGIDIKKLSHVINFEIPNEPEAYVHRIGRTGRAEATGVAMSFSDETEHRHIRGIERLIKKEIPLEKNHPYHSEIKPPRSSLNTSSTRQRSSKTFRSRSSSRSSSRRRVSRGR